MRKPLCIGEISDGEVQIAAKCRACGRFAKLRLGLCSRCEQGRRGGKIKAWELLERQEKGNEVPTCRNCELNVGRNRCPATNRTKKGQKLKKERKSTGRCSEWIPKWDVEGT